MIPYLSVDQINFGYGAGSGSVLDRFSFSMEQGEVVGIVGSSGSGKSTLLRLIAGLEEPAGGGISIAGQRVVGDGRFVEPDKRGVGMVFQDYALFPHMTVSANVMFGLHRLKRKQRQERLGEMLELVHLQQYAKRYPHELSGGQQQRVALARALAPQPSVLLMDEPFSNLDAGLKAAIRSELRDILRLANMTCLFVSHDQDDIDATCDRFIRM